jgi:hypothetical protein
VSVPMLATGELAKIGWRKLRGLYHRYLLLLAGCSSSCCTLATWRTRG